MAITNIVVFFFLLYLFVRATYCIKDDKHYYFYYFIALCVFLMTLDINFIAKDLLKIKEHLIPKVENKDKLPEVPEDHGKQNNI